MVWKTGTPASRAASSTGTVLTTARSINSAPPKTNSGSVNAYCRSIVSTAGRSPGSMLACP